MTTPPLWPSTLPLFPNEVSGQPQPGLSSFQPDEGLSIDRPMVTATVEVFDVGFSALTSEQLSDLQSFHRTTLARGSLRFGWVHPRSGLFREVKMGVPSESSAGGRRWRTTFQIMFLDITPGWASSVTSVSGFMEHI